MRYYVNKNADNYKEEEKLSFLAFLSNAPNFVLCLADSIITGALLVIVDTIITFSETLHTYIVYYVSRKMRKETGDKYNFGLDRLEVFISFICDILLTFCMLGMLAIAVYSLFNPSPLSDKLFLYSILKVSNTAFDIAFLIKQVKINKSHDSSLNNTELRSYVLATVNDAAMLVVATVCWIFRDSKWVEYLNPIFSIVIILIFLVVFIKHMINSISELSDASIAISKQDEIYDIVLEDKTIIKRIDAVNIRRLNSKTFIEVNLTMHDDVTYLKQKEYLANLEEKLIEKIDKVNVRLVIENEKN